MIWYVEENKRKYPTVIPFHGILLSGMLRKTFRIDELQCCSDVEVLVCKAVENVQVLEAEKKKSAWTDLDRVSFKKKSSMFKYPNRTIGLDRSRQS
jgi:hypothetical protein